MTNKKDFRINARLTGEQWKWFLARAGLGELKVSQYLQQLPDTILKMEDELADLRSENKKLKKQINKEYGYSINDFS